jgi:Tol biopolymer transport system component
MNRVLFLALLLLSACAATEATPTSYFNAPNMPVSLTATPALPHLSDPKNEAEEEGELYFFLLPPQAESEIQLAKVSAACIFDFDHCSPLQIVNVPFPFRFTINALSWSPDGKYAAFSYSNNPNGTPTQLWLFDPEANTWASRAEFAYIDPPFWSADGAWIAFRTQDGRGGEDVRVMRSNGAELKIVSENLPAEGRPYIMDGWLNDNIIMRSALPGADNAYTSYGIRVTDGAVHTLSETGAGKSQLIAAPNASRLAYEEYDTNNQSLILRAAEIDGSNELTLASFTGGRIYPIVWSPNSQWIAFNYYHGFQSGTPTAEVYLVNSNGGDLSLIYRGTTIGRLFFSPNGKYLLVEETNSAAGGHLFWINLATRETKILQAPGLSADSNWYAPSWRP